MVSGYCVRVKDLLVMFNSLNSVLTISWKKSVLGTSKFLLALVLIAVMKLSFSFTETDHNFALRKPTVQSSTHDVFLPDYAVDGFRATKCRPASGVVACAHTRGTQSWWRVDLQVFNMDQVWLVDSSPIYIKSIAFIIKTEKKIRDARTKVRQWSRCCQRNLFPIKSYVVQTSPSSPKMAFLYPVGKRFISLLINWPFERIKTDVTGHISIKKCLYTTSKEHPCLPFTLFSQGKVSNHRCPLQFQRPMTKFKVRSDLQIVPKLIKISNFLVLFWERAFLWILIVTKVASYLSWFMK